jgi:hypothetical protein
MNEVRVNKWSLKHYKPLTEEVILAVMDEVETHVAGTKGRKVLSSIDEAYTLAKRFKGLFKEPFLKKKPLKILRAIVDRCGEAYYEKSPDKLYISKDVVNEWASVFQIPLERINEYLAPLLRLHILEFSDRPNYIYRVNMTFFKLIGPVAQYYVQAVEPGKLGEMTEVVSGLVSIYVITHAMKSERYVEGGPRIPWFLKLSMIYTLSGLEYGALKIRDIIELGRINAVDNYFVIERGAPVELWRSIRTEAFEFMISNKVIESAVPEGYRLNIPWVKIHEEGVKRYVQRVRERYERRLRGF